MQGVLISVEVPVKHEDSSTEPNHAALHCTSLHLLDHLSCQVDVSCSTGHHHFGVSVGVWDWRLHDLNTRTCIGEAVREGGREGGSVRRIGEVEGQKDKRDGG